MSSNLSRHRSVSTLPPLSKESRKITTKSHRNRHAISPLSPSRKWDVELWRRDQRATARDVLQAYTVTQPPTISKVSKRPRISAPPPPTLASTPDAFNLFPQRKRQRCSSPQPSEMDVSNQSNPYNAPTNLHQLRSSAFFDLQRSVEETGEGFVTKMRDWESTRESTDNGRGRKRPQSMISRQKSNMAYSDSEEDVLILAAGSPRGEELLPWGSPKRKRAASVGMMDSDPPTMEIQSVDVFSSSIDNWGNASVSTASEGDNDSLLASSDHVGSATSITTNLASSPMSCSHSSESSACPFFPSPTTPSLDDFSIPQDTENPISSCSDKALAALTLALANGAGGLNDYKPVLDAQQGASFIDYEVGELWD